MAILKFPGAVTDGPNANTEVFDFSGVFSVPSTQVQAAFAGGTLLVGQVLCRNVAAQQSNLLPANPVGPNSNTVFTPAGDTLVMCGTTAANGAGDVYGVFQGSGAQGSNSSNNFVNTTGSAYSLNKETFRRLGVGWVRAGVLTGGTSVKVGDGLVINTTAPYYNFPLSGNRSIGAAVGRVIGYPINAQLSTAITSTGANTVAVTLPSNYPLPWQYALAGITTSVALTVDTGSNQETVTPSGITAGATASATMTVAGTPVTGTITTGISLTGYPTLSVVTPVSSGDTATTAAAKVVAQVNLLDTYVVASNSAGVITFAARTPGTYGNSIALTGAATSTWTYTATATLTGGTNPALTATFANTHAANTPIVAWVGTNGSVILPTGLGGVSAEALVLCDINTLG